MPSAEGPARVQVKRSQPALLRSGGPRASVRQHLHSSRASRPAANGVQIERVDGHSVAERWRDAYGGMRMAVCTVDLVAASDVAFDTQRFAWIYALRRCGEPARRHCPPRASGR